MATATALLDGKLKIITADLLDGKAVVEGRQTIRELILQELEALFEAFTFESVTSPAIYRGRQVFDPDTDPPPLITIMARPEEAEKTPYGKYRLRMPVDIICLEKMGAQNPSVLGEAVLGELISCAFGYEDVDGMGDPVKVGGLTDAWADDITYRSGGIDAYPDQLGQQILHVGITVLIEYETKAGNPYET